DGGCGLPVTWVPHWPKKVGSVAGIDFGVSLEGVVALRDTGARRRSSSGLINASRTPRRDHDCKLAGVLYPRGPAVVSEDLNVRGGCGGSPRALVRRLHPVGSNNDGSAPAAVRRMKRRNKRQGRTGGSLPMAREVRPPRPETSDGGRLRD